MTKELVTIPIPLFDNLEKLKVQQTPFVYNNHPYIEDDFEVTKNFLLQIIEKQTRFENCRRDLERLLQWSWLIAQK